MHACSVPDAWHVLVADWTWIWDHIPFTPSLCSKRLSAGGQNAWRGELRPGWHALCRIQWESHTYFKVEQGSDWQSTRSAHGRWKDNRREINWTFFSSLCFSSICRLFKPPSYLDVDIEVLLTNARVAGTSCCAFDLPIWLNFLNHHVTLRVCTYAHVNLLAHLPEVLALGQRAHWCFQNVILITLALLGSEPDTSSFSAQDGCQVPWLSHCDSLRHCFLKSGVIL